MQFQSNAPIYLQILEDLKRRMITGELTPGAKLPSNRELALEYKINPNTVQRVYREMELEQLCFTKRGIGVFVTENAEMVEQLKKESVEQCVRNFVEQMKAMQVNKEDVIAIAQQMWEE